MCSKHCPLHNMTLKYKICNRKFQFMCETMQRTLGHKTRKVTQFKGSRDSSVGIATGYGLDDRGVGVRVPIGERFFSSPSHSDRPLIQWVPGALSPGVKRQGREADHSPPTSAEVKNTWIYTSTPPYAFMA
jgi:hypothetical protein